MHKYIHVQTHTHTYTHTPVALHKLVERVPGVRLQALLQRRANALGNGLRRDCEKVVEWVVCASCMITVEL